MIASESVLADKEAKWQFQTCFLTGVVDRHLLDECVEMKFISVELHDRDPLNASSDGDDGQKSDKLKYDKLVSGELTLQDILGDKSSDPTDKKDQGNTKVLVEMDSAGTDDSVGNGVTNEIDTKVEVKDNSMSKREIAEYKQILTNRLLVEVQTARNNLNEYKSKPSKGKSGQVELESLELALTDIEDKYEISLKECEEAWDNVGMYIYDVDKLYLEDLVLKWKQAGDKYTHGVSKFRLNELRNQAKPLASAFLKTSLNHSKQHSSSLINGITNGDGGEVDSKINKKNHMIVLKMREPVIPKMRRIMPKGGEDNWSLEDSERLIRKPARYLEADTSIRLIAKLYRPIRSLEEDTGEWSAKTSNQTSNRLNQRPFCRSVFIFTYEDVQMLQAVNR